MAINQTPQKLQSVKVKKEQFLVFAKKCEKVKFAKQKNLYFSSTRNSGGMRTKQLTQNKDALKLTWI
jgi:hypothetical protein